MGRIAEEVFAKLRATGQPLFYSELSSCSMIFLAYVSRHLIEWDGCETGDVISQTIGNNQPAVLEGSAAGMNRYFHFSSQPSQRIHPSRGSSALFVRCLGPAARDRAGAAAMSAPKPLIAAFPSPAAVDRFLGCPSLGYPSGTDSPAIRWSIPPNNRLVT
jgi:hypothetical protein